MCLILRLVSDNVAASSFLAAAVSSIGALFRSGADSFTYRQNKQRVSLLRLIHNLLVYFARCVLCTYVIVSSEDSASGEESKSNTSSAVIRIM